MADAMIEAAIADAALRWGYAVADLRLAFRAAHRNALDQMNFLRLLQQAEPTRFMRAMLAYPDTLPGAYPQAAELANEEP